MVYVTDTESWQRIFQLAADASRWDLPDPEVARYLARSYDYVMDLLARADEAEVRLLDPAGDAALRQAVRVRRDARRTGVSFHLAEEAIRRFNLPESALGYSAALPAPLYPAARSTSN
jgi:GNAT superfamily N-acetyltransferase